MAFPYLRLHFWGKQSGVYIGVLFGEVDGCLGLIALSMHVLLLFSSCDKEGIKFPTFDVGIDVHRYSVLSMKKRLDHEISEISKNWQWSALLINTPRLSKNKRSMDLVKRGAV